MSILTGGVTLTHT
jgi:hypothetical protein